MLKKDRKCKKIITLGGKINVMPTNIKSIDKASVQN